jgi:hypothetical protein
LSSKVIQTIQNPRKIGRELKSPFPEIIIRADKRADMSQELFSWEKS